MIKKQKLKRQLMRLLYCLVYEPYNWKYLFDGNEFEYSIGDDRIKVPLLGEGEFSKLSDYFDRSDKEFMKDYYSFCSVLPNKEYNPRKKYQLLSYYVQTSSDASLEYIFDVKNGESRRKNIIHVGEKGSGKTASQNCWLNNNHQRLLTEKIVWVRCDGHKLFQLWSKVKVPDERKFDKRNMPDNYLLTIEEYLDIQFVYVLAKYGVHDQEDSLLLQIAEFIRKENLTFAFPMSRGDHSQFVERSAHELLLMYHDTIVKNEVGEESRQFSYAFDILIKVAMETESQREKRRWIALSKAIQKKITDHGYWVLRIVDGLDNVHINNDTSRAYYEYMIKEARSFICLTPRKNTIHFMAMRERTHLDITSEVTINNPNFSSEVKQISQKTPDFKEILKRRISFIQGKSSGSGLFQRIILDIYNGIQENANELHHNNIRDFLHNKLSLSLVVYYRIKQLGVENTSDTSSYVKLLELRNRFLNGRLFLNTHKEWAYLNKEPGLCGMNIFYYDLDKYRTSAIDKWYGLCKTRIIQVLLLNPRGLTKKDLRSVLVYGFGYPKGLVSDDMDNLRATGMVDTKVIEGEDKLFYQASPKGEYYLRNVYSDIDTLYYFAIDAPTPSLLTDSGLINAHSNRFRCRTGFHFAAISTGLTFIAFLCNINQIEKAHFNPKKALERGVAYDVTLPFFDDNCYVQLLKNGSKLVSNSDPEDLEMISAYVKKYRSNYIMKRALTSAST